MFLATTAIEQFWDVSQTILFLGEWCRLYGQKHVWSKLDHKVLPYHWDDRRKLYSDFLYLNRTYETYLPMISNKLNEIHGVNRSIEYWRMIVGPWLSYFIDILYDRYSSIVDAAKFDSKINTWIVSNPIQWIPNNFSGFIDCFISDEYNLQLYSQVIEFTGTIPYENRDIFFPPLQGQTRKGIKDMSKAVIKKLIRRGENVIPSRFNNIVFISSYFNSLNLAKLRVSLCQFPFYLDHQLRDVEFETNLESRKQMHFKRGNDDFERLLDRLIFLNIPKSYLEGYSGICHDSAKMFPRNPKVICTATAYSANEGFKFWAAENMERGAKLVICQHGGHYGTGLFSGTEDHEIKIASRYITWGWRGKENKNVIALPAQKLIWVNKGHSKTNSRCIFWNLNGAPRYSYRLYSVPIGPQWEVYFRAQIEFAKRLKSDVKKALLCRPYMKDYGWYVIDRIKDEVGDIRFDLSRNAWRDQVDNAILAVETTNMTTFLESMSANVPTIIFLQPEVWELREDVQPNFDRLKEAGVYHIDVESAAKKVNEIYDSPQSWWNQEDVQDARKEFCSTFARTSDNWLVEWKTELVKMLESREPVA